MREHAEKTLRIVCWLLAALLLFQLVRAIVRNHPFVRATIPAVPTLSADTNAIAAAIPNGPVPVKGEANPPHLGTNPPVVKLETNLHATNPATSVLVTNAGTNRPVVVVTNSPAPTNSVVQTNLTRLSNSPGLTNLSASTNAAGLSNADKPGTNGVAAAGARKKSGRSGGSRSFPPGGGPFMPGMGPGQPLPELPPVVRARIDRIVDSELLGPVIRPQPMALLGIAGNVAFLRATNGQTGLVKEGDSLGDLKLLRIGINRVLVEQDGQTQELTIFSGMGGESLLTTPDNQSNETTNH
jgi:hypothetical protein